MLRRMILTVIVCTLLIASSLTATYFYFQWKKAVTAPTAEEEIQEVTEVIGAYMELPEGEVPTIATVLDKEKLQDQAFFIKAENGDKVLIYTTAKKAILYRPTTKKVIEVAPIYFDENSEEEVPPTPQETTTATSTVRVAYYNGSDIPDAVTSLESRVKTDRPNMQSVLTTSTSLLYQGVSVIDLTGLLTAEAQDIANVVGGTVTLLPVDEIKPDADILIVVGK